MRCPECKSETAIFYMGYGYLQCSDCGSRTPHNPALIEGLWRSMAYLAGLQAIHNQVHKRYWVSWWTPAEQDWVETPFQYWATGTRGFSVSICAVITASNKWDIEQQVKKLFPDIEWRFIEEKDADWSPGERFPAYENRTSLYGS